MTQRNGRVDAYVIGGGPGGLATAAAMKQRGLHGVVLDRDSIGSSWRRHYDRLHLHTPRELSGLPGLPIPREMGRWVARDDVVRYLERYVEHHHLDVRTGVEVTRLDRAPAVAARDGWGDAWTLTLADGSAVTAPYAVVATGFSHTPRDPDVPGLADWPGEVVFARTYRNGSPYAGKDILVVGTGNTGTELAVDLVEHGAARVRLAVRTVPHILRRNTGPYASQYTGIAVRHLPPALVDRAATVLERLQTPDLTAYGMPRPDTGLLTRVQRDNAIPVQDAGIIDAIRTGAVEPVAGLSAFDDGDVVLADGSRIRPDAVVLATGYVQGLEPLLGHLGVLGPKGRPLARGGRTAPGAPGLWFTGFTNPISGMLREMAIDARRIALAMAMTKRREVRALRRAA